jgi:hypothetical protein
MLVIFEKTAQIPAGGNFLGTEFAAQPTKANQGLRVRELQLTMGGELKGWQVRKAVPADPTGLVQGSPTPGTVAFSTVVRQSLVNGAPAQNNDTAIFIKADPGLDSILLPGEQWQITTQNASSGMSARIQYEEVDVAPRRTNG